MLVCKNKKAFTLAEALLTLAIMGIIIVMAMPVFTRQIALKLRQNKEKQILEKCNEGTINTLTDEERKLCPLWTLCRNESSLCYNPTITGRVIIGNSFIPSPLNEDENLKLFITGPAINETFDFNTESRRRYSFKSFATSEHDSETLLRDWEDSTNYILSSTLTDLSSSGNINNTIIGFDNAIYGSKNAVIGNNSFISGGAGNIIMGNNSGISKKNNRIIIGNYSQGGDKNLIIGNSLEDVGTKKLTSTGEGNLIISTFSPTENKSTLEILQSKSGKTIVTDNGAVAIGSLFYYNPASPGTLNIYGDLRANNISFSSVQITSDERLKNIKSNYNKGLKEILALNPVVFTLKKGAKDKQYVGVIAQDVQKILPDAVKKNSDGYLEIKSEYLFYAMLNALKELNVKNTELKQKNDKLKKEIEQLKVQVYGAPEESQKLSFIDKILNFFKDLKNKMKGGFLF